MIWIGLTGGIATGKSSAKKIIEQNGFPVIDADLISHQISQIGKSGYKAMLEVYGPPVLLPDQNIDRKKLGEIIFKSEVEKLKLEAILHPLIQTEVSEQKAKYAADGVKICFYDVPLLFEKKLQTQFSSTILVWCDFQTQVTRLKARNSLTDQQAMDRIHSQMPMTEKLPLAQHCIDNSTTLTSLEIQIKHLLERLKANLDVD